jgi:hypothetical protein
MATESHKHLIFPSHTNFSRCYSSSNIHGCILECKQTNYLSFYGAIVFIPSMYLCRSELTLIL